VPGQGVLAGSSQGNGRVKGFRYGAAVGDCSRNMFSSIRRWGGVWIKGRCRDLTAGPGGVGSIKHGDEGGALLL